MNSRLFRVCEEILSNENEFKKFFGIKTLGEIYDYLKGKVPDLSSDEFGYFVAKVLEEYEKQKGDSNVINLEKLEKIAGGKGFGKRLASGGLALASLLTSQPSLYAAKAGKTEQHTDSYLSGKELGDKDSKARSERSSKLPTAFRYLGTLFAGASGAFAISALMAYKDQAPGDLSGDFDPYRMAMNLQRVAGDEFAQKAIDGDVEYARNFEIPYESSCSININNYSLGLSLALACGKYEFFDAFMNKFVRSVSDANDGLKNALLVYLLASACVFQTNWARYACKNLIEHYQVLNLGDDSRIIAWDSDSGNFAGYKQPGWKPVSVACVIAPVIKRNDQALLRIIFKTGAVQPTDCLTIVRDCHPIVKRAFVRSFIDESLVDLVDLDATSLKNKLIKTVANNDVRTFELLTTFYPSVLNWRISDDGDVDITGKNDQYKHLLIYTILKKAYKCTLFLADANIISNWWGVAEKGSTNPFDYINYLINKRGRKDEDTKKFYCDLYDRAVGQRVDFSNCLRLVPERLGYRKIDLSNLGPRPKM